MFGVQIDEKTKAFFEQNILHHLADAKLLEFVIDLFKRFVAANFAGVFVEPTAYDGLDASTLAARRKAHCRLGKIGQSPQFGALFFQIKSGEKKS